MCCKPSIQKVLQIPHKHEHYCATNIQTSPTCPSHPPSCSCTPAFSSVDRPPTSPSVEERSFHELQFEAMIMRMGILMRVRRITLCAVYDGLQFEVAKSFPRCSNSTGCYILHLVGQVSPVRARICGDQVDPLLLQRVQRLRHVVRQL